MRCVIFGGNGFLGKNLCYVLLEQGYTVRIFDRPVKNMDIIPEGVEWCAGDFTNERDIEEVIKGCDIVYHLISTTLPKSSNDNPVYDVDSNVIGTIKLLQLAVKYNVKKVIFTSSGGTVYGIPSSDLICEKHPTNPICSYGISKLAIEKYLHLFHELYGLDYLVLRISNPYGAGKDSKALQGAVDVFLKKSLNHECIEIWGDGSVVRDYIHVSDVSQALAKGINYTAHHKVMNISSGKGSSLNDILNEIERVLERKVVKSYLSARAVDVPVNVLNNQLAKECLGWKPKVQLNEGIKISLGSFV